MESVGAELSLTNTDIDVNYYGIGLRNKEQVLDITGGTFTAWGAIMTSAGSMSPSDGTLANTNTRITAKDATFISRTLLMGKAIVMELLFFRKNTTELQLISRIASCER